MSFTKPNQKEIQEHLAKQCEETFSYPEIGASRKGKNLPSGYIVDHDRVQVGSGTKVFERAKTALCHWQMFRLDWLYLCWPSTVIAVGSTVGVLIRTFGIWSLSPCRIIYIIEDHGPIDRFGFAYGTLPDHSARGEERFTIEWCHEDDSVWYDLFSFSQPNKFLTRMGYFYFRHLQKQFVTDSKQAMVRSISDS